MSVRDRLAGFEQSPLPTWVDTLEKVRMVWANRRAIEMWNASSLEELCARSFDISESTMMQRRAWMKSMLAGELEHFKVDWTLYPKGKPVFMTLIGTPFEHDDGSYGFLYQAVPKELPIAPEIARFAEAMRHTSAAMAIVSMVGEELTRNPAAVEAFGLLTPIPEWFDDPRLWPEILAHVNAGETYRAQAGSQLGDTPRIYTLDARQIRDPVGGDLAILIHLLDETARLGAEAEAEALTQALGIVERQERRWRTLLDSAPDQIMIVDRDHRIEFVNRGVAGVEGAPALLRRRVETLFDDSCHPAIHATIEAAFERGEVGTVDACACVGSDLRQYSIRLAPIARSGAAERLILISSDVTEQRGLELQLRHSQKMQAVGTLASGLAHDFNNLLTIIAGACELAELDVEDDHPARVLFDEIADAAERAGVLTRQLLAIGRKQTLRPQDLDLNHLVEGMSNLLTRVIGDRVELVVALDPRGCWLHADPGRVEQVLMNLALNARDAMPEGGSLTISTYQGEDGGQGEDRGEALLVVADTGVGMTAALQARIFEPFFTTKEPGKGTGLGLSMVLGLVEQSGGRLELDSAPGRGTRFEIYLPSASRPRP